MADAAALFNWGNDSEDEDEDDQAAFLVVGHLPPRPAKTPPPSTRDPPKVPQTPHRFTTASCTMTEHSKDDIHPFVKQDLKDSKFATINKFYRNIFGLSVETRLLWASVIAEQRWYEDPVIEQALADYCAAKVEKDRYEPFVRFLNRVLELAPGNLPGVPQENPYPLGDVCFVDHHRRYVSKIEEHYPLGANRSPDIVCVLREVAQRINKGGPDGKAEWSDILHWWELKQLDVLTDVLAADRERRGLPPPPTPTKMSRKKKSEVRFAHPVQ